MTTSVDVNLVGEEDFNLTLSLIRLLHVEADNPAGLSLKSAA